MDLFHLFKINEERFQEFIDRAGILQARLEDLLSRAQRVANAARNRQTFKDGLFCDDLQLLHRALKTFAQDAGGLPGLLDWLEREAHYDPALISRARPLLASATHLQKDCDSLCEMTRILHNHILNSEDKIEAWFMSQELEVATQKIKSFPFHITSRIIVKLSTPPGEKPG